jgi:cobyrinic acid a,c-diamide synthase
MKTDPDSHKRTTERHKAGLGACGHTLHHFVIDTSLAALAPGKRLYHIRDGEKIFRSNRLTASYLHCYFPFNPAAAAGLFFP